MKDRKHRLVQVTDADEIAAIERGDLTDPIGGPIHGFEGNQAVTRWYAERATLDAYRAATAANTSEQQ